MNIRIGDVLHQHTSPPQIQAWTGVAGLSKIELGQDCLSFSTQKTLNSPVGSFTLTLMPCDYIDQVTGSIRQHGSLERLPFYFKMLEPQTPTSIGVDEAGGIMFGPVIRRDFTSSIVNGQVVETLTIQGADFGKGLLDQILKASIAENDMEKWESDIKAVLGDDHPIVQDIIGIVGPGRGGTFLNMSIQDAIDFCRKKIGTMQVPLLAESFGGRGTIGDFVKTQVQQYQDDKTWAFDIHNQEGTLLNFVQSVIDPDWYEMWMDTFPNAMLKTAIPCPVLVVRPRPFDEPSFVKPFWPEIPTGTGLGWDDTKTLIDGIPYHEIQRSSLRNMQLGTEDDEAFSYYIVTSNDQPGTTESAFSQGLFYPILDLYNCAKFGIKQQMKTRSTLVSGDIANFKTDSGLRTIARSLAAKRNQLFCWYRANPYFLNGSITVDGYDRYRVGDKVRLEWLYPVMGNDQGVEFYVSSVSQQWSLTGYTTTLGLQRGHNASFWTAYQAKVQAAMPVTNPKGWTSVEPPL